MTIRSFDLNIETVLENWEVEHALREIIANALDEQVITNTKEIEISKDWQGNWHIRDFGRGLQINHFTLNENQEKLNAQGVIGKFGVGLKDALATLHRRNIHISIRSRFGSFRLREEQKYGFQDITTLHVEYDDTRINIQGTEFILYGVKDEEMAKAKSLFLKFVGVKIVEGNLYGQILQKNNNLGQVYIQGVLASEEPNFLYSYNITSLTDSMKKKLNRERLNIGRATYVDRVKAILKNAKSKTVEDSLVDQVRKRATGEQCDEMAWIEISQMALNLMHKNVEVVYFTEEEIQQRPDVIGIAKSDGYQVVVIDEQQKSKLENQVLTGGPQVRTVENYIREFNTSFDFKFIDIKDLSYAERSIFAFTSKILALIGLTPNSVPDIRISETMRITDDDTGGVWDLSNNTIVIKRSQLSSLELYSGTLLHEVCHATTLSSDVSRRFEMILTHYLGKISAIALGK